MRQGQRDGGRGTRGRWVVGAGIVVVLVAVAAAARSPEGPGWLPVVADGAVGIGVDDDASAAGPSGGRDVSGGVTDVAEAPGGPVEQGREEQGRAEAEDARRDAEQRQADEEARQVEEARRAEARREAEERRRAEEERRRAEEEQRRIEEERRRAEEEARRLAEEERQRITAAQERLRELGYLIGPVDGKQGQQTTAAVMAFQSVNGLSVDGVIGPQTEGALASPPASPQLVGSAANRVEVDLTRQVLHLIESGERVVTMKVSSGNGAPYQWADGTPAVGNTPVGAFRVQRRIRGVRESSLGLGTLYDPMYFHLGYAIHGSNHVPAGPASHGCVRLSRADAVWLFDRVPNGTPVVLHGGTHVFSP